MQITYVDNLFALAVFWHFVADWFFQSHAEAMVKAHDRRVRAWHCLKYTLTFMAPIVVISRQPTWVIAAQALILFLSHYVIDSYVPVMLWAKHLRRHPAFNRSSNDMEAFRAMAQTPIGLILIITIDQLLHIAFLIPIAVLHALYAS